MPYTRREIVAAVFMPLILLTLVSMSMIVIPLANPLTGLVPGITVSVLAGYLLFFAKHRKHHCSLHGVQTTTAGATAIRQPRTRIVLAAAAIGGVVIGAVAAAAALTAVPFGQGPSVLALTAVTVVAIASFCAEYATHRIHPASISLDSKGITQRGMAWEQFLP